MIGNLPAPLFQDEHAKEQCKRLVQCEREHIVRKRMNVLVTHSSLKVELFIQHVVSADSGKVCFTLSRQIEGVAKDEHKVEDGQEDADLPLEALFDAILLLEEAYE